MGQRREAADDERDDYALLESLLRVNRALRQTIVSLMHDLDLTEPLADALWQLSAGQALSRRDLAERLRCDPSNVTFLVDRLEERGLAERAADPRDRRVKAVRLTEAGALARSRLVAGTAAAPLLTGLTGTQKQQLTELLQASLANTPPPGPMNTKRHAS
jgi:DNA-binding MarR family transcriptional regulator